MDQPDAEAGAAGGMIVTSAAAETRARGRELGQAAKPGAFLALIGPLGAGKTEMAKGVAEGLGVTSVVNSPTFVLMNEHQGRLRLFHIDAYRLSDPEEAIAAGLLEERQADGVTVAEWADRLDGWLPSDRLELTIEPDPQLADRRTIIWRATGIEHTALAARAFSPP
ncbi:MAG: tRNA (adenosine(37)-N6)-threonylcarbamoyltransferase complex ATPase subunit type 1 TsaE [Chloroflexi bacterium]|nr:MAG: tRNA (adenosine(37)-N6)-threonylcarbamoyltransferase complex ATPase subunit type 1 TsaE [Chloroflexota bacterium]